MRVLFVSHDFLPGHPSGTEIYTAQLAARLRERGHDVQLFTTEKDVGRPHLSLDRREWEGMPVHELVNNHFYGEFEETWDWAPAERAFEEVLDEVRPDVVHFMHLLYLSAGCVERAAKRGLPVFYTLHDFWLQCARFGQRMHADGSICDTIDFERCGTCLTSLKFAQSPLQRRTARVIAGVRSATGIDLGRAARGAAGLFSTAKEEAEWSAPEPAAAARMQRSAAARDTALRTRVVPNVRSFLAPSRFLMERFAEWGVPPGRLEHVPYGLEQEPFRDFHRRPAPETRVVFLGTLVPHKGAHVLLEAWARLPEETRARGRLTLHGPRRHQPAYQTRLDALAAGAGARIAGAVERADVPGVLAETDLLVVPSLWYENSPLTIHEALATRTPPMVSDLGGMAELVQEGENGWRFRVGDAQDLAARLARVLEEPEVLERVRPPEGAVPEMSERAEEMEARYVRAVGEAGAA